MNVHVGTFSAPSRDELREPTASAPRLSVVIPVYDEQDVLEALFARLYPALDALDVDYEIVFVDDGSRDRSGQLLAQQFRLRPDVTRVVVFASNFGQHRAILAGFEYARGERIVTLDADLQNPPEDVGLLLEQMDAGHDYVGTIRRQREDRWWRRAASRAMNRVRERITHIRMTDQGCMMRAYGRGIVDAINRCDERYTFIPALAWQFARNPVEIVVGHGERFAGRSKYSLYRLVRLNFDLMTAFSIVPLQMFSLVGMLVSTLSAVLVVVLVLRRLIFGPEEGGLFTLFAIEFLLMGLALFGIGLLGEYVGRIYQEVRHRPRYLVSAVLQDLDAGREQGAKP